jgi:hypothetical protein
VPGGNQEEQRAAALQRRYLIRFEEDMLRSRPLSIRLIIEFVGTFLLVTMAAGAGVINHYAGGHPIIRAAAVIAAGALVMALIYAWGPLSGLHINPAVTIAFYAWSAACPTRQSERRPRAGCRNDEPVAGSPRPGDWSEPNCATIGRIL